MQRREDDIRREHDEGEDEPDATGQKIHRDERAGGRDHDRYPSVEQQPVTMDAHRSCDQRRDPEQSGQVEDVRAHHHTDAGLLVSGDHGRDR